MTRRAQCSRLTKALLDTAGDMRAAGVLDVVAHRKITLRHFGEAASVAQQNNSENPKVMSDRLYRRERENA